MTVHVRIEQQMPSPSDVVFATIHDYHRRLEWDTLLRRAETAGDVPAGKGVVSTCTARRALGGLSFTTVYKAFDPPTVAAVKLVSRPWLFESWGAAIRHEDLPGGRSLCTYTMTFRCRPRWAAPVLERLAALAFRLETARRLGSLAQYLAAPGRAAD